MIPGPQNAMMPFFIADPVMYSGGETSGLESSFTSPSVHQKDFIEQYLNKLSYLPSDVITNSEPLLTALGSTSQPLITTSYNSPFYSAAGPTTTSAALGKARFFFFALDNLTSIRFLSTGTSGLGASYTDILAAAQADKEHHLYNSFSSETLLLDSMGGPGGGIGGGATLTGSGNNLVDMLEIPGKGRCFVYFARYSYDPFQQSLNDNPESELPLTAGDYVLVWGDADEDGYLEGELLDGRKGLVSLLAVNSRIE